MAAGLQTLAGKAGGKPSDPASAAAPADRTSHAAFRQFMEARSAGKARAKPVNTVPAVRLVQPTPERLVKTDHPRRTANGAYRVPAPIERLRDRCGLDHRPRVNEAMYTAATTLAECFYNSGLAEHIRSQDLGVGPKS